MALFVEGVAEGGVLELGHSLGILAPLQAAENRPVPRSNEETYW